MFEYFDLRELFEKKAFQSEEIYSANFMDLTRKEKLIIKNFFDDKEGYNKILFAKKYIELIQEGFFKDDQELEWISTIKTKMKL